MKTISACAALLLAATALSALPVSLGTVDIGLESYDGYQEGRAVISASEDGTEVEILLGYRGFGLDTVSWTFGGDDVEALANALESASLWRSRLLEYAITQVVEKEAASLSPTLTYRHRDSDYLFEDTEHSARFVRQGREYALTLGETTPGADTRRSGDKSLPVFILHVSGPALPELRDLLSAENIEAELEAYAAQGELIDGILSTEP